MDEIAIAMMGLCAAALIFAVPIGAVIFFVQLRDLQDKMRRLDERLYAVELKAERGLVAAPAPAAASAVASEEAPKTLKEAPGVSEEAPKTLKEAPGVSGEASGVDEGAPGASGEASEAHKEASEASGEASGVDEGAPEVSGEASGMDEGAPDPSQASLPERQAPPPAARPEPPQKRAQGLEQTLGGSVAIWGGAGALGLAAILLVQYGVQNAVLGPTARLGIGASVSLGLVIAGEVVFRKLRAVGGGLVGAGIVGLYASFGAASALYGLISPLLAGGLMVLTTAVAAALSIRHNLLIIAVIGLLGGFLTPLLIGVRTPDPWGLMIYLTLLNVGVVTVVAWRRWPSILLMAAVLNFVAEMGWLFRGPREENLVFLALMIALLMPVGLAALSGAGSVTRPAEGPWGLRERLEAAAKSPWVQMTLHLSLLSSMIVAVAAAAWWRFPISTWGAQLPLLALGVGLLATSAHMPRTLPTFAYMIALVHQWLYLLMVEPDAATARPIYFFVALLFVVGLSLLTWWRPERRLEPGLAMVIALIQYLMAYLHAHEEAAGGGLSATESNLWTVSAGLGMGFFVTLSAASWWRHRQKGGEGNPPSMMMTALAGALFAFVAAPIALDGTWLTLAWFAQAVVFVALGQKIDERSVSVAGLVVLVAAGMRLLTFQDLEVMRGGLPVVNWILVLFAAAVAASALCAFFMGHLGRPWSTGARQALNIIALGFFLGLVTLEIRHFYHPDLRGSFTHAEDLSYSVGWMLVGLGVLLVGLVRKSALSRWVSLILVMGTSLKIFLLDLSFLDGLWRVGSVALLGVILIAIATLYRLFVFTSEAPPDED